MPNRVTVASADFARNCGYWQEQAMLHPVAITHHGRERFILITREVYEDALGAQTPGKAPEQNALDIANARLTCLLDNSSHAFTALDDEMRVMRVNRLTEAYFALGRDELVGRPANEVGKGPAADVIYEQARRVKRTGDPVEVEVNSSMFDGRQVSARIFPYPGGVGIWWANQTDKRLMQNALEENIAVRSATEAHPFIGVSSIDTRGRFAQADETFTKWSGFSEADLKQCRIFDIITVGDRRRLTDLVDEVLQARAPRQARITLIAKGGGEVVLDASMAPIVVDRVEMGVRLVATRHGAAG